MSVYQLLLGYALYGLPVGLLTGLGISLIADKDGGWGGYGSFRRRAARLGHVSTVMLPLIGGFFALALMGLDVRDTGFDRLGGLLWVLGGITLPIALFVTAWRRSLRWLLPAPALALTAGAACIAIHFHSYLELP